MDNEINPELYTIWDEAKGHIERGDYEKAIEIYRYLLVRHSDDDVVVEAANAYLGDIYLTLKKLDLAEQHIKKALLCKPENPAYHYILGFVYSIQSQWDKAIGEFEIAVEKEPDNGEYLRGLGWAVRSAGDKAKGLAYLNKAVELEPHNANILTDLAVAYLSDLQFAKARKCAKATLQIEPESSLAKDVLDSINRFQKEFKQFGKP